LGLSSKGNEREDEVSLLDSVMDGLLELTGPGRRVEKEAEVDRDITTIERNEETGTTFTEG